MEKSNIPCGTRTGGSAYPCAADKTPGMGRQAHDSEHLRLCQRSEVLKGRIAVAIRSFCFYFLIEHFVYGAVFFGFVGGHEGVPCVLIISHQRGLIF